MLDVDNAKSYVKESTLMATLEATGFIKGRPIVVCNRQGRFTAVFASTHLVAAGIPVIHPAEAGFPVVG